METDFLYKVLIYVVVLLPFAIIYYRNIKKHRKK